MSGQTTFGRGFLEILKVYGRKTCWFPKLGEEDSRSSNVILLLEETLGVRSEFSVILLLNENVLISRMKGMRSLDVLGRTPTLLCGKLSALGR